MNRNRGGFLSGVKNAIKKIIEGRHEKATGHAILLKPVFCSEKTNPLGNIMSDCNCNQNNAQDESTHVPNFTAVGFAEGSSHAPALRSNAAGAPNLEGVEALKLSVCVGASYNPTTNQICFSVPIYGNLCITSPIHIPVGGQLKACAQTCGSFIPTGLKVTIYLNGNPIYSGTVVGRC
ncbi:hypothetical protein AVME950_17710 [Acidovorax sp. SUPP950]|uniref:hypothetical protein n=1 Tax=unclassified Acidovorax TaxID=2684926 RepID=UPI0023CBBE80|nr:MULTISPECIES: hypothetical protein [Comamonadaceae]WOI47301.1 hypothetical protein R1Z03_08905 [Paracidovorax avenae]GKS76760.1 hypothetical protein AVME950_17710 [Acidovorax sp. SUPP950]